MCIAACRFRPEILKVLVRVDIVYLFLSFKGRFPFIQVPRGSLLLDIMISMVDILVKTLAARDAHIPSVCLVDFCELSMRLLLCFQTMAGSLQDIYSVMIIAWQLEH